jgi:hypothetical protein
MPSHQRSDEDWAVDAIARIPAGDSTCYVEGEYNDVAGQDEKRMHDDRLRTEGCAVDSEGRADRSRMLTWGGRHLAARGRSPAHQRRVERVIGDRVGMQCP